MYTSCSLSCQTVRVIIKAFDGSVAGNVISLADPSLKLDSLRKGDYGVAE